MMKDEELLNAVYAYNRRAKEDHARGLKLLEVKTLTETMGDHPDLGALLMFLKKLRDLLK